MSTLRFAVPYVAASLAVLLAFSQANAAYVDEVLADEPFLYLQFNETSGSTANDSSGNGNHGTYVGGVDLGVTSTSEFLGGAARFDGSSGLVQLPNLNLEFDQFTVETFVNVEALAGGCCTSIFSPNGWTQGWVHYNLKNNRTIEFALNGGGPNNHNTPANSVPFNEWLHIASTYDKDEAIVHTYINGEEIDVSPPNFNSPQTVRFQVPTQIAAWQNGRYLRGSLDEFALYGSALSAEDIQRHYAARLAPPGALGDVNGDEVVDEADFEIIRANFYQTAESREQGDLNFDGLVDLKDLQVWRRGRFAATGAAAGVPEPSAAALALLVISGMAIRRRR